jgi:hypothetical protein
MDPFNFNLKFTARQANTIHKYKDLKLKITNCNANIHFNRQCLAKGVIPNYANKINQFTYCTPHGIPSGQALFYIAYLNGFQLFVET